MGVCVYVQIYTHIVFECTYRFDLDRLDATKHSNYKRLIVLDYNNQNSLQTDYAMVFMRRIYLYTLST